MIEWNRPGQAYTGRYLATMGTAPSKMLVLEQPNGVEVQLPLAPKLEESFQEIQPGTLVRVVYQGNVRARDGGVRQAFRILAEDAAPAEYDNLVNALRLLADDPCELLDDPEHEDDRTAVERPTCGSICRVCRARILLARIERARAQPKKKRR